MNDLIKREDATETFAELYDIFDDYPNIVKELHKVYDKILAIPSAEKQGEWIDMGDFEQCSVCKGTHLKEFQSYYGKTTWIKTPYCPNCGARMKGADDE